MIPLMALAASRGDNNPASITALTTPANDAPLMILMVGAYDRGDVK